MEEPHRISSPYRRRRDLEAGSGRPQEDESSDDPFDITSTKHVPVHRLRRWRQAALVLNASRRFRYTLDLKKEEQVKITLQKIRAHAQAIRAAQLFQAGQGQQANGASFSLLCSINNRRKL
ncbi:hypothetical protein BT93_C0150 [Corymbia citriodora subsp. variegata]|nr:hypothetical protein BT93_C0150 [Corymbia citriodora subsp. variegata]